MIYFVSAFSPNMLITKTVDVQFRPIDPASVIWFLQEHDAVDAIGHQSTADVIQSSLGLAASPFNRIDVKVDIGDTLCIAQYSGPRLDPGTTTLPVGATIEYLIAFIQRPRD